MAYLIPLSPKGWLSGTTMEGIYETLNREVLPKVSKPSRYVDNELNVVHKDHPQVDVKVVLAFPDLYELGMSYTGYSILYHILNRQAWVVAERVYAPWMDMEGMFRSKGIPLFSLETRMPVKDFDVVGFTLQHELNYTNILNMLDLSGIPIKSADRTEADPLVIAGGPCAYNPEPMAEFIDAFVIGDGEEAALEVVNTVRGWKREKGRREELFRLLAGLEGVYVPALYEVEYGPDGSFERLLPKADWAPESIKSRKIEHLASENYPDKPLVSLMEIIHDRLTLEIMRGCTKGCRYCHAGMTYRPLRERPVEELLEQARRAIAATGWDEISLLSLSTTDYSCLDQLVTGLNHIFSKKKVAISLPSMRPDSFTPQLAKAIQAVRKTGLTFAPEAGTERLRRVINRNFDEFELLRAIRLAFENGWNLVKLYFMIGLPTEGEGDLAGMVKLIKKVLGLRPKAGGKSFNLTISPFTPKAHTPFQWEVQDDPEVLQEKIEYLRRNVPKKAVRLKWHNPEASFLEGIFARGDRRLGPVLVEAWRLGCKFDGWTDNFRFKLWNQAFEHTGINPKAYVCARDVDQPLPWDHIETGVAKEFLIAEQEKALRSELTPDCRLDGCQGCGIEGCGPALEKERRVEEWRLEQLLEGGEMAYGRRKKKKTAGQPQLAKTRFRLEYSKGEEIRWISHLDLVRTFERAIRRADIPIAYSQGYHPHPKISFGPPLPLGMTGEAEYVDLQLAQPYGKDLVSNLQAVLPKGFWIVQAKPIFGKTESLSAAITLAEYEVDLSRLDDRARLEESIASFLQQDKVMIERVAKDKEKRVDIRALVDELQMDIDGSPILKLRLKIRPEGSVRPLDVIEKLFDLSSGQSLLLPIRRTGLYIARGQQVLSPMDMA